MIETERLELEHLTEQHERGDHGRGLEVTSTCSPAVRNASGNAPGASVATTLNPNATTTPSAMRVNIGPGVVAVPGVPQ